MKILFIARHFAYFRNYESVIETLAARGHRVHLAAEREEELGGRDMVERLAAGHPGISIGWVPERGDRWRVFATRLRLTIDYLRYLDPAYDSTPKLRARARERVPRAGLWLTAAAFASTRTGRRLLGAALRACERAVPRSRAIDAFITDQRPDVVLLTPLIGVVASPQADCLQSAKALGHPTALCVWSWDHLSSKAIVRNVPDRIFVWNETQRDEAISLHGVAPERIVVTGAQCFDQWFDRRPSTDRDAFCRTVGLPADRPFLLYVCSSLFRGTVDEAQFVLRWIRALRGSGVEPAASTPILVRPHPARMKEWSGVDLSGEQDVAWWGQSPVTPDAKNGYFDSLHHSSAVVGLNTSAFLEAAIAGRPVFATLLPEHYENQEGTIHFHYLLKVGGGLLHAARTLGEHVAQLNACLAAGERESPRSRRFVEAFIRPRGVAVPATPVFVEAVEALASGPADAGRHGTGLVPGPAEAGRHGTGLVPGPAEGGSHETRLVPDPAGGGLHGTRQLSGRAAAESGLAKAGLAALRLLLWPVAAAAALASADWLVASERDRAIAARHRVRRGREQELRRAKAARKDAQRREKEARAEARRQHKVQRAAEWRRAKQTRKWKRRIDPGQ